MNGNLTTNISMIAQCLPNGQAVLDNFSINKVK
jgi:hypothetical protein